MSKFWAAIRRLLGKKDDGDKKEKSPNDVQKAPARLHPYDDVDIDAGGVAVNSQNTNTQQTNNTRPARPYDEVGPPDSDGKVTVNE